MSVRSSSFVARGFLSAVVVSLGLLAASAGAADKPASKSAHPDFSGFWNLASQVPDEKSWPGKLPANTVLLKDTGVWEYPRDDYGGLKLTAKAQSMAKEWNPKDDMSLTNACKPPSIVYAIQGPFPFELYQTPQLIVLRYEYFDQTRLVFMDGRGHPPADAPHSKMGHSIGRWDGDELVIDTTHVAPSTITNNGLDHSADIHMVERYKLSADGKRLSATQWFEDPAVLDNNGARVIEWTRREGQYVYPYECDPSFAIEYQQAGEGGD